MNTIMAGIISLFLLRTPTVLGSVNYSLENRYSSAYVNEVFADNILLTLAYMSGRVRAGERVIWEEVRAPLYYELVLAPGETFAFHEQVLPQFKGKVAATTNAHFNAREGFRSDGYLMGDGVCHLASFLNVVAQEAGLAVVAPTDHSFAKIEDVAREQGVSIYYDPEGKHNSMNQNLYITNNRARTIALVFQYKPERLDIGVTEK